MHSQTRKRCQNSHHNGRIIPNKFCKDRYPGGLFGLRRDAQVVKVVLDTRANPDGFRLEKSPLYQAVDKQNESIVKLLLESGADPSSAFLSNGKPMNQGHYGYK